MKSKREVVDELPYLRRNIFPRKASASARDNQIDEVIAVCSLRNSALNLQYIIWHDHRVVCFESSRAFVGEHFLERGNTFVGGWVFACGV